MMRSIELKILVPFLAIIIISLGVVGSVSYYGSYKIFESLIKQPFYANTGINADYISNQLLELQKYTILVAIIAIIAAAQLTIFFSYSLARPIKKLAAACDEVSKGNFNITLDYSRKDEIGILKDAFIRMTAKLQEHIAKVLEITSLNQKIIDGVNYGIVVFTRGRKKLLVNRLASHEFNNYPIIREFVENLIQDFLSGKAPTSSSSTMINDKNGSSKFVEYDIQPSEDNFILCFSDITEKERFKQKMEYINRLTSIGEMSAALAHEIRNPLQGIKSCLQVLETRFLSADDTSTALLNLIYGEIKRINNIISDLLNYARPSEPKPEYINLRQEIEDVLPLLAHLYNKKHISIKIDITPDCNNIFIDKSHFKQILINLLSNSIHASQENTEIVIFTTKNKDEIVLSIRDQGKGIPEEYLEKVFIPFFTTEENGTGLGLSVVQSLVLKNHGHIWIQSKSGIGTTINFAFPFDFAHFVRYYDKAIT
ncbi:HAMP domain-containing protein [Thermoanaerobacteraceae bacterium SP2]|nr:HAMP domain-containing protein [Thermoanaerobacteraceae bacterium SP2]